MNQITREAQLRIEAFRQAVAVEQSCIREGIGTGQEIDCPVCRLRPNSPVDEIILRDGIPADIALVVAGFTVSPCGDAVLHYGNTDIALTEHRPIDVQDYWSKVR